MLSWPILSIRSRVDVPAFPPPGCCQCAVDAAQQRGEDHSGDNEQSSEGSGLLNKLLPHND